MEAPPLSFLHAFIWSFGVVMVQVAGLGAVSLFDPRLGDEPVLVAGWLSTVYLAGAFAVRRVHLRPNSFIQALGLRATQPKLLLASVALGVLAHAPVATLERLNERLSPSVYQTGERAALLVGGSVGGRLLLALCLLGCVAPLCQECFFRGVLYSGLTRSSGARAAALVTGLCCVVANPDLRSWLPLGFLALLLSLLRLQTGSLLPSLCLHVAYGSSLAFREHLGFLGSGSAPALGAKWELSGWLSVAALAYWVYRIAKACRECATARAEDES